MRRESLHRCLGAVWLWLAQLFQRRPPLYKVVEVEELPSKLHAYRLYMVGPAVSPWFAALTCPCGCAEVIQLSLLPEERPSWSLTIDEQRRPSLHPSVWRTAGCRSHFFLCRGTVRWCSMRVDRQRMP